MTDFITALIRRIDSDPIWLVYVIAGVVVLTGLLAVGFGLHSGARSRKRAAERASRAVELPVRSPDFYNRRHVTSLLSREFLLWRADNPPDITPDDAVAEHAGLEGSELAARFGEYARILDQVLDPARMATILYRAGIGINDPELGLVTPELIEVRAERSGLVLAFDATEPPTPMSRWESATEFLAMQFAAPELVCVMRVFGECWVMLRDRYTPTAGDAEQARGEHERNYQAWDDAIPDTSARPGSGPRWTSSDDFDDTVDAVFDPPTAGFSALPPGSQR